MLLRLRIIRRRLQLHLLPLTLMKVRQERLLLWAFGDFVCLCILFSFNTTPFKKIIAPKDSGRINKRFRKIWKYHKYKKSSFIRTIPSVWEFHPINQKNGSQTLLPVGNCTPPWSFVLIYNSIFSWFVNNIFLLTFNSIYNIIFNVCNKLNF